MTQPLIQHFHDIPVFPKTESVLIRLGGRRNNPMDPEFQRMLEQGMKQVRILCRPTGVYLREKIADRSPDSITLENGIHFQSRSLSRLLQFSEEVVLMAATVGHEIVAAIADEVNHKNDAAFGLILDAAASQTADMILDWIMDYLNGMLAKKGLKLTRHRYSPGYGDLPLDYQKPIFEALNLKQLGLKLTEKYMLIPEKSVIAIAGIEAREMESNHG